MADRPRSGIVGAGFIGEVHARAVRAAGGVLAAVADRDAESAAAAATRLLAERAASSAEELVEADDIDVVHICTPNHLHAPLAERAMAAGKHVICEKPLSTDVDGARRLADLAGAASVVTAVPFVYRFYPTVRDARGRVRRGDVGALRLVHGSYLQDWLSRPEDHNWRVDASLGGGSRAFGDIGVHWCDVVEFATGHRITRLVARMMTVPRGTDRSGPGTEDAATVLFETDQGAIGAPSSSARSRPDGRTGCGSPSTARRRPCSSTRNCPTRCGWAGGSRTPWSTAAPSPRPATPPGTTSSRSATRRATSTASPPSSPTSTPLPRAIRPTVFPRSTTACGPPSSPMPS